MRLTSAQQVALTERTGEEQRKANKAKHSPLRQGWSLECARCGKSGSAYVTEDGTVSFSGELSGADCK